MSEYIENFLQQNYNKSDRKRLGRIVETAISSRPMSPECRVVVNIPVYHQERCLFRTLKHYLDQEVIDNNRNFEVITLINGPMSVDITASAPFRDANRFKESFPEFSLTIASANYQKTALRIGRIRKDLAGLTIERVMQSPGVDISKLVLTTHDADLVAVPSYYISHLVQEFDNNPNLGGLTGFVGYPYEDFYGNHLLLAFQRYVDVFEAILRHREDHFVMRGGNSAFRLLDYMEAGGHKRNRVSENRPLYHSLRRMGKEVKFSRELEIITSPRRHITAQITGVPQASRYNEFGKENDLAQFYQVPEDELIIPEIATKVTSPSFVSNLREELQVFYGRHLGSLYQSGEYDISREEHLTTGEHTLQSRYEHLERLYPDKLERLRMEMKRAAMIVGLQISFDGSNIKIDGIHKLRSQVLKRYNNY